MARIGGRSLWLAVPVGVLCAAVIGALLWLAIPMVPVSVAWVGDTLRASTERSEAAADEPTPAELVASGTTVDCRDLYPDALWAEMIWHGDVLLGQGVARPAIALPEVGDALGATMRVTCTWRFDDGTSLVSGLASVTPDAAPAAEAAFAAAGFACSQRDAATVCDRSAAGVTEEHVLRDGLWLSTVQNGWAPVGYGPALAGHVWQ
ncbi:hypothetical protein QL996_09420 [Planococcus sp. APC 4015]|nr:hypothetical protein [Planococcus sp. APC 4015]